MNKVSPTTSTLHSRTTPIVIKTLLFALASLAPVSSQAQNDTIYVSDVFYVPLYSGTSTKHRIVHRGIKSGTALTVLDVDESAGFTKVQTSSGKKGWIQNQYVSEKPVARILLQNERRQRSALQEKLNNTNNLNQTISQSKTDFERQVSSLTKKNQSLSNELTNLKKISSNAVNLDINNRELLQKNELLKVEIAELQTENARLSDKSSRDWFIRGALAVAIGALLAIIIPKFKPRSRNSEWG